MKCDGADEMTFTLSQKLLQQVEFSSRSIAQVVKFLSPSESSLATKHLYETYLKKSLTDVNVEFLVSSCAERKLSTQLTKVLWFLLITDFNLDTVRVNGRLLSHLGW